MVWTQSASLKGPQGPAGDAAGNVYDSISATRVDVTEHYLHGGTVAPSNFRGLTGGQTGTALASPLASAVSNRSCVGLNTGTTATGTAGVGMFVNSIYPTAGGTQWKAKCCVMFPNLSDGTNTYNFKFGFTNHTATGDTSSAGAYFQTSGSSWQVASGNGTNVSTVGTIVANTWYVLEIWYFSDGTPYFYIDGNYVGTAPLITGNVGMNAVQVKTVGTTSRFAYIDYMSVQAFT